MTETAAGYPLHTGDGLWVPETATITRTVQVTEQDRLFEIELECGRELSHQPGQFVQLSAFGFGEAPISVCSSPALRGRFELCIRDMGGLTRHLQRLDAGDHVGVRGPLGNGFPVDNMEGMDCLIVAGGIGLAPLRSLINTILADRDRYGRLVILYGSRTPKDMLFADELSQCQEDSRNEVLLTVDEADSEWEGHTGVVTTLFPNVTIVPDNTVVVSVVGPPVMYRFVFGELSDLGVPPDRMYFSLERRMKCGVGKCGHCQIEGKYVCMDGPVFSGSELLEFHENI